MENLNSIQDKMSREATLPTAIYDEEGYDGEGYDKNGYDRYGYDRYGYDRDGYDTDGYDEDGYDRDGEHRDDYDEDGYDCNGYDRDGYDRDGYDYDGYDFEGYDSDGYNYKGRDKKGHTRSYNKFLGLGKKGVDGIAKGMNINANTLLEYQVQDSIVTPLLERSFGKVTNEINIIKSSITGSYYYYETQLSSNQYINLFERLGKHAKKIFLDVYHVKYKNKSGMILSFYKSTHIVTLKAYFYGPEHTKVVYMLLKILGHNKNRQYNGGPSMVGINQIACTSSNTKSYRVWDNMISRYKDEIEDYLKSWEYANRYTSSEVMSIQTGFIFEGPPGSGKSTMAMGIASLLGYSTYYIDLEKDLTEQFNKIQKKQVVIMEDIDILMGTVVNDNKERTVRKDKNTVAKLSKLMNLIDGKVKYDHVIFIATTNNIDALDYALKRPGRFNKIYTIGNFNEEEIRQMCLSRNVNPDGVICTHGTELTPAQLKVILDDFLFARKYYLSKKHQEFLLEKYRSMRKGKDENEDRKCTASG
ncbi:MAG: AAA family ATPase [Clostridium sp.]|nr:AAA family ATPase [Clostridium sp.]